jgi:putative tricarboxylic transport membrane protein
MIFGLTLVVYLSSVSVVKAFMMGVLGLLLGTVGVDTISGQMRFGLGITDLMDGIGLVPIGHGCFWYL